LIVLPAEAIVPLLVPRLPNANETVNPVTYLWRNLVKVMHPDAIPEHPTCGDVVLSAETRKALAAKRSGKGEKWFFAMNFRNNEMVRHQCLPS
jgi:hypothetical protein